MKKVNIDGLLALKLEEIQIIYRRCRGDTVQKVANDMNIGASTIHNERMPEILKLLEVDNWKELESLLCVELRRIIPSEEALQQGWPEAFREKIEALRETQEKIQTQSAGQIAPNTVDTSANQQSSKPETNQTFEGEVAKPARPRFPAWPAVAIPLLILCLLCVAGAVFARPIIFRALNTNPPTPQASQTPQIEATSTATLEPSPTFQLTDTQLALLTVTLTFTLTFTPTPTITPIPTDTKSPIGLVKDDPLSDNRVTLKLKEIRYEQGRTRIGQRPIAPVVFIFDFTNNSGDTILVRLDQDEFRAEDNLGNQLTCEFWNGVVETTATLQYSLGNQLTAGISVFCGEGKIPPSVTAYTLYVTNFSSLPDSTWIAEVAR